MALRACAGFFLPVSSLAAGSPMFHGKQLFNAVDPVPGHAREVPTQATIGVADRQFQGGRFGTADVGSESGPPHPADVSFPA